MQDLKDLKVSTAAAAGTIVELESPKTDDVMRDDDGEPHYVEVRGEDSPEVREIDRKHANRRAERIRKGKSWDMDSDTLESEAVERLTAATISWYLPPIDGVSLEFSVKNARTIYGDPELAWIPEQVAKAMKDRKRFFSPTSKS